jgi:hypothetical protein
MCATVSCMTTHILPRGCIKYGANFAKLARIASDMGVSVGVALSQIVSDAYDGLYSTPAEPRTPELSGTLRVIVRRFAALGRPVTLRDFVNHLPSDQRKDRLLRNACIEALETCGRIVRSGRGWAPAE